MSQTTKNDLELTVKIEGEDNLKTLSEGKYKLCVGIPIEVNGELRSTIILRQSTDPIGPEMHVSWPPQSRYTYLMGSTTLHYENATSAVHEGDLQPIQFRQFYETSRQSAGKVMPSKTVPDHKFGFRNHMRSSPMLYRRLINRSPNDEDELLLWVPLWIPGHGTIGVPQQDFIAVWFENTSEGQLASTIDDSDKGKVIFTGQTATITYNADSEFDTMFQEEEDNFDPATRTIANTTTSNTGDVKGQVNSGANPATLGANTATPGANTATPGANTATPGANTATPGVNTVTPGANTATPDANTATPGVNTVTPGVNIATPGVNTATPDANTVTPGVNTATPDANTVTPGVNTATPDANTATPGVNTATPDANTVTPGVNTATPDANTATPDANTATSGAKPVVSGTNLVDAEATPSSGVGSESKKP